MSTNKLAIAALTGLLSISIIGAGAANAAEATPAVEKAASADKAADKNACKAADKNACKGKNECKGKGADGKNACKGKGSCATPSKEATEAK